LGRIFQRGERWYIQYDSLPGSDGKRRQKMESCGPGASDKDAEALLRRRMVEVDDGQISEPAKITLGQFLDVWLAHIAVPGRYSPTTVERYTELVRAHIAPRLGHLKMRNVTTMQMQTFLDEKQTSGRIRGTGGLAPKTVKHLYTILRKSFEYAVRCQVVKESKAAYLEPIRINRPEIRIHSDEDLGKLYAEISRSRNRVAILIALGTGMRRGEICGLHWGDFDEKGHTFTVRRSLARANGEVKEKSTKTGKPRAVGIPESLLSIITEHKADQAAAGKPTGLNDYICQSPSGGRLCPKVLSTHFYLLRRRVGVEATLHGLRHTYVTNQLEAGVDVRNVADQVGHASVSTTYDIYAHSRKEHKHAVVEVADRLLNIKPTIKVVGE
jgi:integrase